MATLGDLLNRIERERFVGRGAELAVATDWLGAKGRSTPILALSGEGGIGKSWLVHRIVERASAEGRVVALADGHLLPAEAEALFETLTGHRDLEGTVGVLSARPTLLVVDTFEAMEPLAAVLQDLIAALPDTARVLLAGRRPLGGSWSAWRHLICALPLGVLSNAEQHEYLHRRGINDPVQHLECIGRSGGHPLALSLAADLMDLGITDLSEQGEWQALIGRLVTGVRAGLGPGPAAVLEAAAVLGQFDTAAVAALADEAPGAPDVSAALAELSGLSLIHPNGGRLQVHDEVRRAVLEDLRLRRPDRLEELRRRGLRHYRDQASRTEGDLARRVAVEAFHMMGRDIFALAIYYDSVDDGVRVERGATRVLPDLVDLIRRRSSDGVPPAEELRSDVLQVLLDHPGGTVNVARALGGEVVCHAFWLAASEHLLSRLPGGGAISAVVRAAADVAGMDVPAGPGGSTLYYLSSIIGGGTDRLHWGALAQDLAPLFLDEGLYVALTADPVYRQVMTALGFTPFGFEWTETGADGSPVTFQGQMLDLSTCGFSAWMHGLATGRPPARLPDGATLVDLVRTVVARWDDDDAVAATLLAAVAEPDLAVPAGDRAAAARQLLRRALAGGAPFPTPEGRLQRALAEAGIGTLPDAPGRAGGGAAGRTGGGAGHGPASLRTTGAGADAGSATGGCADEGQPAVWVRVLGGFEVRTASGPAELGDSRAAHLLQLLVVRGPSTAEMVIDALWPDADLDAGRTRLRSTLARLRRAVGVPVVERSGGSLQLAPGVDSDLARFEDAARRALAALADGRSGAEALAGEALAWHRGEVLPGQPYDDWVVAPRWRVTELLLRLLDDLAARAVAAGEVGAAITHLERAIAADPHDESRYVRTARMLLSMGAPATALAIARRGRAVAASLGVAPSAALRAVEEAASASAASA